MSQYFLNVDYGGTNTKVVIFDEKGQQLGLSSFETRRIEKKAGYREVDLLNLWSAICQAIKESLTQAQILSENLTAICCIGHGKGLYALGKDKKELINGILSTDNRATRLAQQFEKQVDQIWEMTKQHITEVQSPVLLRWLKIYQPSIYQKIGFVLAAKDYIRYKLTGKINQEYGDASGNHWLNFQTGIYDQKITNFFGIEEMFACLPPLVESTEIVGGISKEAALATGLKEGTPVIGGLFDIDACAIGSGVLDEKKFSVISGTWNINTYPSEKPAAKESGLMNSYFSKEKYLIEAGSPTSAGNLNIMIKMLMNEEIENAKLKGGSIYDDLEVYLREHDATYSKLIFMPFLYGSNIGKEAEACFFGLTTQSSKSEMLRAVYEGIIFAHKQHLDQLVRNLGSKPKILRLSGGATNSNAWMQMFSDVLGLPIETVTNPELGCLGGAVICLQAINHLTKQEACKQMIHVKQQFFPREDQQEIYQKKYEIYRQLLTVMEPVWETLCDLRKM
ncbi:Xylulose kinase [Enterococcus faecalis NY9]|nr:Xylulose kinase [Enterococcus faecalis NY9]